MCVYIHTYTCTCTMYTVVLGLVLCYLVFIPECLELIRCTCMMYCDLCFQLKLRNVVTMQQEKLLGEREAALEKQHQEKESLRSSLTQKDEEVCTVQVTLYVHIPHPLTDSEAGGISEVHEREVGGEPRTSQDQ